MAMAVATASMMPIARGGELKRPPAGKMTRLELDYLRELIRLRTQVPAGILL